MSRKFVFVLSLFVLLSSLLYVGFNPVAVKATNGYPVHNLDTGLNYTSIQEAIDAPETLEGHKIFVEEGTYYENVVVNKRISLIGQDRETTIIDGRGNYVAIDVRDYWNNVYIYGVNITGFTVRNASGYGIRIIGSDNCTISDNSVIGIKGYKAPGISVGSRNKLVQGCTISNNSVIDGSVGISIAGSNHVLEGNIATENLESGLVLYGDGNWMVNRNHANGNFGGNGGIWIEALGGTWIVKNNRATNNTVAGITVKGTFDNCTVTDNVVEYNTGNAGVWLYESNGNILVTRNIIGGNGHGLPSWYRGGIIAVHSESVITDNLIVNNTPYGIGLWETGHRKVVVYHNNFIDNMHHVGLVNSYNGIWDDGYPSGGNYWSDYIATANDTYYGPFQNETGSDGIGDTPYVIDMNNQDNYPLMSQWGPVHNTNTGLHYQTIQSAIDAPETLDGHTIFVEKGIYFENVDVDFVNVRVGKSVTLIGEDRSTTIVDGNYIASNVIYIWVPNVTITNLTIRRSSNRITACGIYTSASHTNISNNIITDNEWGLHIHSSDNSISGNTITANNEKGLYLEHACMHCDIFGNNITNNDDVGIHLSQSSNNNKIFGNNIKANFHGIAVDRSSSSNTISGNTITANNETGIFLWNSFNNTISGNNITNNDDGIKLYESSNNKFYHTNFIDNAQHVRSYTPSYANFWDNGVEGNYWSDYVGVDADHDGIGDIPYAIYTNNRDNYPLMGVFSDFPVSLEEETYHVTTVCNSTISAFQFNQEEGTLSFNVTGPDDTVGFCRIMIPTALINGTYTVLVDGEEVNTTVLPISNSTHSFLYFTYSHSTHNVKIFGTIEEAVLIGEGWGRIRIKPRKYVWGRAKLYKVGDEQIKLVISHRGEEYSRVWNIVCYRERKYSETYLCYDHDYGPLIVTIYKRWSFWRCRGRGVLAIGFIKNQCAQSKILFQGF